MASINKFCERMRYWCIVASLGYDQGNRWDIRDGGECDCSSLVLWCLYEAGFIPKPTWGNTASMWSQLKGAGFIRVPNNGKPQKGDILLNEGSHVAVWLGDCLAQASIDERGRITGGAGGDQTGNETNTRGYYNYPWDVYLRYVGKNDDQPVKEWDEMASKQEIKDAMREILYEHGGHAIWDYMIGEGEPGKNDLEAWKRLGYINQGVYRLTDASDEVGDGYTGDIVTRIKYMDQHTRWNNEQHNEIKAENRALRQMLNEAGIDSNKIAEELAKRIEITVGVN